MDSKENKNRSGVLVPQELPGLLKNYTKALLRNQPEDIVLWSANYFQRLSLHGKFNDAEKTGETALSAATLKKINKEFGDTKYFPFVELESIWGREGLAKTQLAELMSVGEFYSGAVPRARFICLAAGALTGNFQETLLLTMEILSEEREPQMSIETLSDLLEFMSGLDEELSTQRLERALGELRSIASRKEGILHRADVVAVLPK